MIKDKIESLTSELKHLKIRYKNLVNDIKETFYEKKEYFVDDSPRHPQNEKAKMSAAYCLATNYCPRGSWDLKVNKAQEWNSKLIKHIEKWYIYSDKFETPNGTKPVILLKKKNIKLLDELCKEMWMTEVKNEFGSNRTTLGLKEWLIEKSDDYILELLYEHINGRIEVVTDRGLSIKDVVVIYPFDKKHMY